MSQPPVLKQCSTCGRFLSSTEFAVHKCTASIVLNNCKHGINRGKYCASCYLEGDVYKPLSTLTKDGSPSIVIPKPSLDPTVAIKYDQEKPDMALIPSDPLLEVAKVLTYGKKKYAAHNWRAGFIWSRPLSAAMRHLVAFIGGQDKDPETGISHLAHAICMLLFVLEFETTKREMDDRYKETK